MDKPALPRLSPKSSVTDFVWPHSTIFFKHIDLTHKFLSDPYLKQRPELNQVTAAESAMLLLRMTPENDF